MRELRVYSLMRSGCHAICNWIYQQCEGAVIFANNIGGLNWNPGITEDHRRRFDELLEAFFSGHAIRDSLVNVECNLHKQQWLHLLGKGFDPTAYNPKGVDTILELVEDDYIQHYMDGRLKPRELLSFVPSETHFQIGIGTGELTNIIILRDPYNFYASRLEAQKRYPNFDMTSNAVKAWKIHAREFCRATNRLFEPVLINYNDWFDSELYRRQISQQLHLTFNDAGHSEIPPYGSGTSFSKQPFTVLERYKQSLYRPEFQQVLHDEEVHKLAHHVFGFSLQSRI